MVSPNFKIKFSFTDLAKKGAWFILDAAILYITINFFGAAFHVPLITIASFFIDALFFLGVAIFSKPLGAWRKVTCFLGIYALHVLILFGYTQIFYQRLWFNVLVLFSLMFLLGYLLKTWRYKLANNKDRGDA